MRRVLASVGLFGVLASVPVFAQDAAPAGVIPPPESLQAIITGPQDIAVGRTIILDGSLSRVSGDDVQYSWYIDDNPKPISGTVEAVYTPELPGQVRFRLVITAVIDGVEQTAEALQSVTVYNRKVILVADSSVTKATLEAHRVAASATGVYLRLMQPEELPSTPLGAEEMLASLIAEQSTSLLGANSIILWADGIVGLQALMRVSQADPDLAAGLQNQTIVLITDRSLQTLARTARGPFGALKPARILITRKEAIPLLLSAGTVQQSIEEIDRRDLDYLTIDQSIVNVRPWNLLSTLVNFMLAKGVPSQTVILLLVLPVIATILAFLKQVVGITTFGLYTPSIIALSFLALGWKLGVFFLLFIILTGYATRATMRRWRLLYIPKVAIILTVVSVTLLLLMGLGTYVDIGFTRETVFILLIMSTLAESFLNMKTEQGLKSAVWGVGETVAASLLCVFIVQWGMFQSTILAYPELILLTIIINAFLGRWTGLRLVEFIRFREVFKHLQEE
jgi:hypothetical protein